MNDRDCQFAAALAAWRKGEKVGRAVSAFLSEAEAGRVEAQFLIGRILSTDRWGMQMNAPRAVEWLKKADEGGYLYAAHDLATIFDPDNDVPYPGVHRSRELSAFYFKKGFQQYLAAAGHGSVEALDAVSVCYACGWGTEVNVEKALEWRAAYEAKLFEK